MLYRQIAVWLGVVLFWLHCHDHQALATVDIVFDYSLDQATTQFFNPLTTDGQAARNRLNEATGIYESLILDEFSAITPGTVYNQGTDDEFSDSWIVTLDHPGTGNDVVFEDLQIPAGEIRVSVGARNLGGLASAVTGSSAIDAGGFSEFVNSVFQRGQQATLGAQAVDFAPWGNVISFDTHFDVAGNDPRQWHFGQTTDGLTGKSDFLSIAQHELAHLLGFGDSDVFTKWVSVLDSDTAEFRGPKVMSGNGGVAPGLEPGTNATNPATSDLGHWLAGTTSNGRLPTMTSTFGPDSRGLLTELDLAAFTDMGWELSALLPGDFNDDNSVDIDILRNAILASTSNPQFNLDGLGGNFADVDDFDFLLTVLIASGRGDADLNKLVNFDDFVRISNNFHQVGAGWGQGNFNLDNITNFDDFVELTNRFNQQCPCTSADAFTAAPEPDAIALLLATTLTTLRRPIQIFRRLIQTRR